MSWPRKDTRTIIVEGKQFLWHISKNRLDGKDTLIAVGKPGMKYMLFIDPYPWEFKIEPSNISKAMLWALSNGWDPEIGPTRYMSYSDRDRSYIWLPKGIRLINEMKSE